MFGKNVKEIKPLKIEEDENVEETQQPSLLQICAYVPPEKRQHSNHDNCTMCTHFDDHYGVCTLTHDFVNENSPMCRAYLPYMQRFKV